MRGTTWNARGWRCKVAKDVDVRLDLGRAIKMLRLRIVAGMERAALWVEGEVKRSFQPGTGRASKRGGKIHRASAPGEPPAVDTGRLRSSITHDVQVQGNEVVGLVGTNIEYARRLELGFVGTDRLGRTVNQAARPFLRPAVFNNKAEIIRQMETGARKAGGGA